MTKEQRGRVIEQDHGASVQKVLQQYLITIAVWADLGRSFFNQETQDVFTKQGVAITHAASGSHKYVGMVRRFNHILQGYLLRGDPVKLSDDGHDFAEGDMERA